jgi:flagellar biosynthesis/type III secretory pathway chaperone
MADPWSSNFSLLTKLAAQQRIYHLCHASRKIPTTAKKSLALLLAAYEYRKEEELGAALSASIVNRFSRMEALIFNSRSVNFRNKRIMEVEEAAKTLSDTEPMV